MGLAHHGSYLMQIRLPGAAGLVVGMTDIVPRNRLLTADITLACHRKFSFFSVFSL